jgi:hypothetical protein
MDQVLSRLAALFTGNFSFLGLVRKVCEDTIRAADIDNSILEAHPFGPLAGTRRRITELEHAVAAREQELAELRRRHWETECSLAEANRRSGAVLSILKHRVANRLRRVRTVAAPDGGIRHRVLRKMVSVVRVARSEGLRGVLARVWNKLARARA